MGSGTIAVTPKVFAEVMRTCGMSLDEINALPFEERARMVGDARIRLATQRPTPVPGDEWTRKMIREDRERRKAEAWARRQPKK